MDFLIIITAILIVISMNILIVNAIIRKTVNKLIIPKLTELSLQFISIKRIGFMKTGNFPEHTISMNPFNQFGNFKMTLYRNISYQNKNNKQRDITVRINWNLFKKTTIDFKPVLK
ncbi:hypothetical protein [Plebeiibacterium sediminum]|uniref:Uncharacterized protein n=1 Tax=Plebeiibacterium sediminum TaxID=2992112 RepID=A0AAE3MAT8_9BACT|nr:hypothetical protein [Plebeiobacterium sediminum]MCW3789625.1 hypothetical protein [Plebeiobacterium sediminum]